jgi:hypothetical protein
MLFSEKLHFVLITNLYTEGNFRKTILGNIYLLLRQGRGGVCELYLKIYNILIYYIF